MRLERERERESERVLEFRLRLFSTLGRRVVGVADPTAAAS